MGQTSDGTFTAGQQNGAAQIRFPLQAQGDYYARTVTRELKAKASAYAANFQPALQTRTSWTNSLTYSEALTNAAWTATNLTVTDNQIANPADGDTTMSKGLETTTNGEHRIAHAFTFTAVPWTVSCIVRGGLTRTNFYIRANDGTNDFSGYFDISAGTVGTLAANTTGAIQSLGNSSWRLSITFTPAAAAGNVYFNVASGPATISYAGTVTNGMYIWGCEAKAASQAGPYISTTSVARTISAPNLDFIDAVSLNADTPAAADVNKGDPFAYLCVETEPNGTDLARGMANWARLYARIPKQLVTYSTMAITKPTATGIGTPIGARVHPTNAIPPDTTLYGGYYFSTYDSYVYGTLIASTSANSGSDTDVTVASTASFDEAEGIMFTASSLIFYAPAGTWSISSGTVIKLEGANYSTSVTGIAVRYRSFTSGPDRVKIKLVQDFYLPGVTTGITTAADIPVADPLINDSAFIDAVIANLSGYVNYDAEPLQFWLGPIYTQIKQQIDMGDV